MDFYGYEYSLVFNFAKETDEVCDLGNNLEYKKAIEVLAAEPHEVWDAKAAYDYCNRSFEHF